MSYDGAKAVVEIVKGTSIHELALPYNNLNTEEKELISQALLDNNITQESYILNDEEELLLAEVLQSYSAIKESNISHNNVIDERSEEADQTLQDHLLDAFNSGSVIEHSNTNDALHSSEL
ncbi:hypothetical protein [Candidatus Lariskella endosymbiont of Hedychridium roseum]|uniref:hypothetical protein n=1 Tax=Candidatus Lariskella endosymbiont of Hedychridium roseum TaxID=3077949 RepID=UPI0030D3171F